MTALPTVPANAKRMQPPIGGTLILLMLPDHFTKAPAWVWPVCWTLWCFVLVGYVYDIYRHLDVKDISEAKWKEVFK